MPVSGGGRHIAQRPAAAVRRRLCSAADPRPGVPPSPEPERRPAPPGPALIHSRLIDVSARPRPAPATALPAPVRAAASGGAGPTDNGGGHTSPAPRRPRRWRPVPEILPDVQRCSVQARLPSRRAGWAGAGPLGRTGVLPRVSEEDVASRADRRSSIGLLPRSIHGDVSLSWLTLHGMKAVQMFSLVG